MIRYHDEEWGIPQHGDSHLFEMLTLEGAQAGLSWSIILHKRSGYRRAFEAFDLTAIATYGGSDVKKLMADGGIVRNRAKILSVIHNAGRALVIQQTYGSLDAYLWGFAPSVRASVLGIDGSPDTTPESDAMSTALKRDGWKFVGSKTCYSFMQASGMVDDHDSSCFRARHDRSIWPE